MRDDQRGFASRVGLDIWSLPRFLLTEDGVHNAIALAIRQTPALALPFSGMRVIIHPTLPFPCAVTEKQDLIVGSAWYDGWPIDEKGQIHVPTRTDQVWILIHEAHHWLRDEQSRYRRHCLLGAKDAQSDFYFWNVASDVLINEGLYTWHRPPGFLGWNSPAVRKVNPTWREDTETLFDMLVADAQAEQEQEQGGTSGGGEDPNESEESDEQASQGAGSDPDGDESTSGGAGSGDIPWQDDDSESDGSDQGGQTDGESNSDADPTGSGRQAAGEGEDDSDSDADPTDENDLPLHGTRAALPKDVQDILDSLPQRSSTRESNKVREATWKRIAELAEQGKLTIGVDPGSLEWARERFLTQEKGERNWRSILKRLIKTASLRKGRDGRDWNRQDRRWQSRDKGLLYPGRRGFRPLLLVVTDTSGSMWTALTRCQGELNDIFRATQSKLFLAEGDTNLTHFATVSALNVASMTGRGGGGTNMVCVIQEGLRRCPRQPDAVVLLTDGYTPWPAGRLPMPLIVVLIGGSGIRIPEWAHVVDANQK